VEVDTSINIDFDYGTLSLFKHIELDNLEMQSKKIPQQVLNLKESRLRIITQNIKPVFNEFDIKSFDGLKVTYEKPAKGGGIISLNFKKNETEVIDGFYIYLNIEKNELTGWNYKMWNEKVEWFNKNIISMISPLTKKQTIEKYEYRNC
jgi:hypothetical protein